MLVLRLLVPSLDALSWLRLADHGEVIRVVVTAIRLVFMDLGRNTATLASPFSNAPRALSTSLNN